jgi:SAM-dependent methyltransferase
VPEHETPDWFERAQSGFSGDAVRWEAARRAIVRGIDGPGSFLDVGCANGLLMESVARWSTFPIEAYGVDFSDGLVARARCRLPECAERLYLADVRTWTPPRAFDFVHVRLDMLDLRDVRSFGRRVIVSSDGSFRRRQSPRAQPVADILRARGWNVEGHYERHDAQAVEIAVAWTR